MVKSNLTSSHKNPVGPLAPLEDSLPLQDVDGGLDDGHQVVVDNGPLGPGHLQLTGDLFRGVGRVHGGGGHPDV